MLADGPGADAVGIDAFSYGSAYVYNNGNITVTADESYGADTLIYAEGATAIGINAVSGVYDEQYPDLVNTLLDGPNDVNVVNGPLGVVTVLANGTAIGINANALADGGVYVYNAGSVSATSVYADAWGIVGITNGLGNIEIYNSGSVTSSAYDRADGIDAWAYGDGAASVTNSGSVYRDQLLRVRR